MATGFRIASAWVEISADTKGLRRDAKAGIVRELRGLQGQVKIKADTKGLRSEVQRAVSAATRGQAGKFSLSVNSGRLRSEVTKAVKEATKGSRGQFRLGVDSTRLRTDIEKAITRASKGAKGKVGLKIDAVGLRAELREKLAKAAEGVKVKVGVDLDTTGLRQQLRAAILAAQAGQNFVIPVRVDGNPALLRTITQVNNAASGMSRRMRMWAGVIVASLGAVAPAIGTVINMLQAVGPAALVSVPMVSSLALTLGTVAVAGNGVAHAIAMSAESAEDFEEALDKLTPQARNFVEAVVSSKGAFKEMQSAVQEVMFSDLDDSFRSMAKQTIPDLQGGLGGTAIQLNRMAKSSMAMVESLSRTDTLKKAFGGLQLAFEPIVSMPAQFLSMWTKTTIAAGPLFLRMTTAAGRGVDSLNAKVDRMFASGELQGNINRSADAIVGFFRKIGNNPEWQRFADQVSSTGPELAEVLGRLGEAALKLMNNAGPLFALVLKIADGFARLVLAIPDEIIATILGVAGAMKVMSLAGAGWAAITGSAAVASLTRFVTAARMTGVATAIRGVAAAMSVLQKATVVLAVLSAVVLVINKLATMGKEKAPDVDKLTKALDTFGKTGKVTGELADKFGQKFQKLGDSLHAVTNPSVAESINNWGKKWSGGLLEGGEATEEFEDKVNALDDALADMVQGGNAKYAQAALEGILKSLKKQGEDTGKVEEKLKDYKQALEDQRLANQWAAETMGTFGNAAMSTSRRLEELKADTDGLVKSLFALNNANRDAGAALGDYERAADDVAAIAKKRGINLTYENGVLSENTDLQREAANGLRTLATNTEKAGLASYQATGSWANANKIFQDGRKTFIDNAVAMGLNRTAATQLANDYLKIPSKKELLLLVKDQASGQLRTVAEAFKAAPDKKEIKVDTLSGPAIAALQDLGFKVTQLPDGSFSVIAKTAGAKTQLGDLQNYKLTDKRVEVLMSIVEITDKIKTAQEKVDSLKQKKKTAVGADKKKLQDEIDKAQKALDDLKQKRKVSLEALDKTSGGIDNAKSSLDKKLPKTVTVSIIAGFSEQSASAAADAIQKQADRFSGKRYGGVIRRASGGPVPGFVSGPGGPTADRVPALLSNGEFVMRAAAVSKYGTGLMRLINTGQFPRFAKGGSVGSGGGSGSAGVSAATKTGTFTVQDATGKPVASALENFKALESGVSRAYDSMGADTTGFGQKLSTGLSGASTGSRKAWDAWASGMRGRTDATYKAVGSLTNTFSRTQTTRTTATSSQTQRVWDGWKSGMTSRTRATYSAINTATNSFQKQSVSTIGRARDGMGSAWGGLSPKFKPPVSYLVHTVINRGVVGAMNAIMGKLGGGSKVGGISVAGFASGGPVYGSGTKTSDSIPARLSNGEFVMQAKAVDKFGVNFMSAVNQGRMPHDGAGFTGFAKGGHVGGGISINMPRFATGGVVGVPSADALNKIMGEGSDADVKRMTNFIFDNYVMPLIDSGSGGSAMKDVQRQGMRHIRSNVEKFVKDNFGGAGSASAGLRWAKTQHGKPYQWGGNGNPSWDCSGFMSAIESVIRGEKPHRRWSTHAFNGGTPPGWKAGANAPFKVGITHAGVGHTAGTIGRTNVESAGGSAGVRVGSSARGYNDGMFTSWYGFVGGKAKGGYISGPGGPTSDRVAAMLSNGEYVIRAAAVKKLGTGYLSALNSGRIPGFATGGSVGTTYKVKYGDTLSEIAVRFGTTVKALMELNKSIKDANKIYAGMTLVIKKATGGSGSSGGSGSGGFSLPGMSKVGKSGIQSADGINALKGIVTISEASKASNATGATNYRPEIIGSLTGADSISDLMQNFYELANQIRAAFKGSAETAMLSRLNTVIKAMTPLQKNLDGVSAKLVDAQKALDDVKQKFDSLKDSVSGAVLDFGKITKIGSYGTSGTTLLNQLQKDVTRSQDFAKMLEQLKAKGVSGDLIGQIAEAGITGGGMATAQTVLNMTPEQLAQLNSLQGQLTTAANKAGTAAAQGMYGAGVNAAQGLVKGLEDQQKAIEAQMLKIAQAMEKAIKQALGIKSPSRVMMRVADFTADGLVNQLGARTGDVGTAMRTLVGAPAGAAASVAVQAPSVPTQSRSGTSTYIDKRSYSIAVHVDGTGMNLSSSADRRAIAKALAKEIKEEIRRDDKAHR
ncbi:LysM peptidoglycan-binding domain-containing protein [Streptomyces sp. ISL-10]|uniref:LysM peptidoglycan-binding domain-containing protein n=1 Tax=Streptomyces sp. ISL-10 TaxID=2819172 RepID=UPI001BEBDD64|nr:LysM domain-containing protein [Streptomyces sp. ISL-10]MBT2365246.1 LysM peptidoglycan-binding domain-containing protein [Streptomyces sp. ISL-10]